MMGKETKKILKELKSYKGRGSINPKAEFFHNTAIELLMRFESRYYKDIEIFCEVLKSYAKTTEIMFRGVQHTIERKSDEQFYSSKLEER